MNIFLNYWRIENENAITGVKLAADSAADSHVTGNTLYLKNYISYMKKIISACKGALVHLCDDICFSILSMMTQHFHFQFLLMLVTHF